MIRSRFGRSRVLSGRDKGRHHQQNHTQNTSSHDEPPFVCFARRSSATNLARGRNPATSVKSLAAGIGDTVGMEIVTTEETLVDSCAQVKSPIVKREWWIVACGLISEDVHEVVFQYDRRKALQMGPQDNVANEFVVVRRAVEDCWCWLHRGFNFDETCAIEGLCSAFCIFE